MITLLIFNKLFKRIKKKKNQKVVLGPEHCFSPFSWSLNFVQSCPEAVAMVIIRHDSSSQALLVVTPKGKVFNPEYI